MVGPRALYLVHGVPEDEEHNSLDKENRSKGGGKTAAVHPWCACRPCTWSMVFPKTRNAKSAKEVKTRSQTTKKWEQRRGRQPHGARDDPQVGLEVQELEQAQGHEEHTAQANSTQAPRQKVSSPWCQVPEV